MAVLGGGSLGQMSQRAQDTQPLLGTERRVLRKGREWKKRLWDWERNLAVAHDPGGTTPRKWHSSQLSLQAWGQ